MKKALAWLTLASLVTMPLMGCAQVAIDYCDSLESCDVFADGLLAVREDDEWGYVNNKGDVVIDFQFDGAGAFINGTAMVVIEDKFQLINKKGQLLLDEAVDDMTRDLSQKMIIYEADGNFSFMTEGGRLIDNTSFDGYTELFGQNLLAVKVGTKWGYANTRGDLKIDAQYDSARMFTEGLAVVKQNDKYGYINDRNHIIIDIEFASAQPFDSSERAIVTTADGTYQLIDKKGEVILEGEHIKGNGPIYGVRDDQDIYRLFDANGDRFTSEEYTNLWGLGARYANVEINSEDLYQIYDDEGDVIRQESFDESDVYIDDFGNTILVTIDELDEEITIYGYDEKLVFSGLDLAQINKERVIVMRNNRYGAIDYRGVTKVEFYYNQMLLFSNEYYLVEVNSKYGVISDDGGTIVPMIYEAVNPFMYPLR